MMIDRSERLIATPTLSLGRRVISTVCSRSVLKSLALGQCVSILICGSAVTSGLLQEQGVNVPTAQSFLSYVLLCLVFTTQIACRQGDRGIVSCLRYHGWKYFLLAVFDVEASYVVVKAYGLTTVTSVQILDCFSIPTVMVLSWIFLGVRYQRLHFLGVGVCLLGLAGSIGADVLTGNNQESNAPNRVLGDVLCLVGAVLYGTVNVGAEHLVKTFDRTQYLSMIGMFGSVINGIQFVILEGTEVSRINFGSVAVVLPFLGFTACVFLIFIMITTVLRETSATTLNLSMLSSDFYTLLFGLFLFKYLFHWLFFVAFAVVIIGVVIYSIKETATKMSHDQRQNDDQQCSDDDEEGHSKSHDNLLTHSEKSSIC